MTVPSHSLARRVALGGLFLVLAVAAWRVLTLGMADHHATQAPADALAWRGGHPEALLARAEELAADPAQAGAAEAQAKAALRADPLDGRGYRVLGQLADAAGDPPRAATLYGLAVARTPRDAPSQAWLARYHLSRGDAAQALVHLDVLLRIDRNLGAQLLPVMVALAESPAAHDALLAKLSEHPPWRGWFLTGLNRNSTKGEAIAPLMDRLRKSPGGLSAPELLAWLDRLADDGHWGAAYLIWVSQLPAERQRALGNVYNGGFEWEPGQGGFDWRFGRVAGARIERLPEEGAGGDLALRLAFEDRRVPFKHVRQLLALPPGEYRLRGRARPEQLRSGPGLVWTVSCATSHAQLGETQALRGSGPWRDFEAVFEVPAQGCEGQWLSLVLPARIPAEQRIGGRAWFDDLKITRVP